VAAPLGWCSCPRVVCDRNNREQRKMKTAGRSLWSSPAVVGLGNKMHPAGVSSVGTWLIHGILWILRGFRIDSNPREYQYMTKIGNSEQDSVASGVHAGGHTDIREWLQTRPGERTWISIPAAETNGAYSVVEIVSSPGDSTPMHVHQHEDEHFVIVEGTARIALGASIFDAVAGTSVTLPRKIPHAWGNATDSTLRMVVTCTPGGVEEVLRLMVQGGPDIDLMALANKYGVQIVGPMLLGA